MGVILKDARRKVLSVELRCLVLNARSFGIKKYCLCVMQRGVYYTYNFIIESKLDLTFLEFKVPNFVIYFRYQWRWNPELDRDHILGTCNQRGTN